MCQTLKTQNGLLIQIDFQGIQISNLLCVVLIYQQVEFKWYIVPFS